MHFLIILPFLTKSSFDIRLHGVFSVRFKLLVMQDSDSREVYVLDSKKFVLDLIQYCGPSYRSPSRWTLPPLEPAFVQRRSTRRLYILLSEAKIYFAW